MSGSRPHSTLANTLVGGLLLFVAPLAADGQAQDLPSVEQILTWYEEDEGRVAYRHSVPGMSAAEWVERTLFYDEYPTERVDSVVDGLIALAKDPRDLEWAQISTSVFLASLARGNMHGGIPWPGSYERLIDLYWHLVERSDLVTTAGIVTSVPHLAVESHRVLGFLTEVLETYPPSSAYPTPRDAAIQALGHMGPEGEELLCQLAEICGCG